MKKPKGLNDFFLSIADKVSYGMGTPANIIVWTLLVGTWIALGPLISQSNFIPGWFTSNSFNFPLNTVTTLAELFIGFLVAAAANRNERSSHETISRLEHMMKEQDRIIRMLLANQQKELGLEQEILKDVAK